MTQYILLIQDNAKSFTTPAEWDSFFEAAERSGMFRGGSEIGARRMIGDTQPAKSSDHIAGYMRFDAEDEQKLLDLLEKHPVVAHGGSVELCVLAES